MGKGGQDKHKLGYVRCDSRWCYMAAFAAERGGCIWQDCCQAEGLVG